MRTALLADLHANREAVAACLAHAAAQGAQRFAFLGDLVGYGPDPGWVLETVRGYCEAGRGFALLGNHDEAVLVPPRASMNAQARAAVEWTRGRLDDAQRAWLASLPLTHREHDRLYVHANAWAPGAWGYVAGTVEAARSLAATDARLTFCGHVHDPMLWALDARARLQRFEPADGMPVPLVATRRWLVVVGSAGQPRDGNPAACYAIHDDADDRYVLHRVPYDHAAVARRIVEAGLPAALARRLAGGGA